MRESEIFSPEEMRLFREVDQQRMHEHEHAPGALMPTPASQSPPAAVMTPEQWNEWIDDRVEIQLQQVSKALSREAGKQELALRSEFRASVAAMQRDLDNLREEIVKLRIELAARGAQERGAEILDLPALPSRRVKLNG
jgi:hypothetical protein